MTNDKQATANKIRALLTKTVENGCTEAEAMAAMQKASALMAQHEINLTEVDIKAEGITRARFTFRNAHEKLTGTGVAMAIQDLSGTKVWRSRENDRDGLVYLGTPSDVTFADWLTKTIVEMVPREAARWTAREKQDGNVVNAKTLMHSFIIGATNRISQRIRAEIQARNAPAVQSPGRGLIVATKQSLIAAELKAMGLHLRSRTTHRTVSNSGAYRAGQAAGDRANYHRPLNGGAGTRQITG
jgi:hypothetical protein